MPRFVVLAHTVPGVFGRRPDHWDLLVDLPGPGLRTWRLGEPLAAPGWLPAEPLAPHRRAYLWLEGATRSGVGWVRRANAGECRVFVDGPEEFTRALP
jgi:hypothetical protein